MEEEKRIKIPKISHRLKGAARLPDEDYAKYRLRRIEENELTKRYLRGIPVWNPFQKGMGTHCIAKHGKL